MNQESEVEMDVEKDEIIDESSISDVSTKEDATQQHKRKRCDDDMKDYNYSPLIQKPDVHQTVWSEFVDNRGSFWLDGKVDVVNPKTCVVTYSDGITLKRTKFSELFDRVDLKKEQDLVD